MTIHDHHRQHPTCCANAAEKVVSVRGANAERQRAVENMVRLLARITAQQILEERRAAIASSKEDAVHIPTTINNF